MRHLFSPAGEAAVAQLMRRQDVLLAFDFDGTLAPIVARPDDARVSVAIARRLSLLAAQRPVAVITGRSVADVRPRLGFEPSFVVGNHGAEGMGWSPSGEGMDQFRARLRAHADDLRAAGVQVEDKVFSLALHYRLARDRGVAMQAIERLLAAPAAGVQMFGGKCVVNVVSQDAPDKGDAAKALLRASGCEALLFVGDDVNDEAVFECAQDGWLTVRIGRSHGASLAMFFLDTHSEMSALLERLQQAMVREAPSPDD
ncbi:trehalose-phosphatase [Roseateles sp. LYH14W]|uniref:Trehalose 6-phosphate phosphatase n=1 Tax=Pelomonas parva TaxID=3299032 RepID=A0ABW7EVK6_9BURK